MKPAVLAAAFVAAFLAALPIVYAAPTSGTRSKGCPSEALLLTRTSPVDLANDLLSTSVSAANSASDTSNILPSQSNQIQSTASTVLVRPSSIVSEESAPFHQHLSLNQLRSWAQRQPRSSVPRAKRSRQLSIVSSDVQSTSHVPANPSTHHLDSYNYPGWKYPTFRSALLAKAEKERERYYAQKQRPVPTTKQPYTRRLHISETATAEEIAVARRTATRLTNKLSKRRFRANQTSEQKEIIKARNAQRLRIRYAQSKAGSLAKVSSFKTMNPGESEVLAQGIATVAVTEHTPASPASVPQFETSDRAHQHEPHTAATSSAAGPQEAEMDPDEEWRSFLAPDLFQ